MLISIVVVASYINGLEIKAADNGTIGEVNMVNLSEVKEENVLYLPEGIIRIEDEEFDGYGTRWNANEGEYATKIVLPSTLEYIGNSAFASSCIEEIVIPGSVKEIGSSAFEHCKNLKTVIFEGDYVEKIGDALFWYCENLETVVMPDAVGEWDTDFAFMSCYRLKNLTVPQEGMDRLGTGMFYACALEEFNIPDCVTTMNYDVFTCCDELKVLRAGYNVVNFVDGGYTGALNISKGCFGTGYYDLDNVWHKGPANMILEAPLDSAIVEYARNYRYFTVKYDYPDFERIEWICDGKIHNNHIEINCEVYPEKTGNIFIETYELTNNMLQSDGYSCLYIPHDGSGTIRISSDRTDGRGIPAIHYFKKTYTTQDENLEYTVEHTDYFRIMITKASLAEKRVQIEILKSGTWESKDAEWELLTPAIDTTVLTSIPTATPTKEVTPIATVTPKPEVITAEVPTITAAPTSKPAITKKVTPIPGVKAVKPAKTSIKSAKQTVVKKHGKWAYKKEVKLSWKKVKNAAGYVIYMKAGTGKYKAVKIITKGKTVSYTKKNLKKGKTYYFKIRTYRKLNGQKVYGNYSRVKKLKIK